MTTIHDIKYFNTQVCEFRNLMGLKSFWADPDKIHLAGKALFTTYMQLQGTSEEQRQASITYEAAMLEFTRRAAYMGKLGVI